MIHLKLSNDQAYDDLVHESLASGEETTIATKDDCTVTHKPGVVISFNVSLGNDEVRRVQQVMTVREFAWIYSALRGRYGPGGPESHRYVGNESPFIKYK